VIIPLGAWQLAGLPRLRVAVNLSACQFRQTILPEFVASVLEDTGMDAISTCGAMGQKFAVSCQ
jgi:EAL domain-containing protein (putative c-di-GMP-specific phosphodiesterase class I)